MFRLTPPIPSLARRADLFADVLLAGSLILAGAAAVAGGVTLARSAARRARLGVAGTVREEERAEEDTPHGVPTVPAVRHSYR